ncbi:MAG: hypothetical protein ACLFU7_07635 [Armatimonadota bacterium]
MLDTVHSARESRFRVEAAFTFATMEQVETRARRRAAVAFAARRSGMPTSDAVCGDSADVLTAAPDSSPLSRCKTHVILQPLIRTCMSAGAIKGPLAA